MIFMTKLGLKKTLLFWGMDGIIKIKKTYSKTEEKNNYIFEVNECYLHVQKELFDELEMVRAFV